MSDILVFIIIFLYVIIIGSCIGVLAATCEFIYYTVKSKKNQKDRKD